MNDTHRFKRFLNNSAQRNGFRGNKLFCQNDHRCDTPPPKGKLLQVLLGRTDRYGSLSCNRNDVMQLAWLAITDFQFFENIRMFTNVYVLNNFY